MYTDPFPEYNEQVMIIIHKKGGGGIQVKTKQKRNKNKNMQFSITIKLQELNKLVNS